MRNRETLSISINDFLSLPPTDMARFHSGSSLEFLLCRFLTSNGTESSERIKQDAQLFGLALRSELAFTNLTSDITVRFYTRVLPYTIAMTSKGEAQDSLMSVLVEAVPSLAGKIDLERIKFVISGVIPDRLKHPNSPASAVIISLPYARIPNFSQGDEQSIDFEPNSHLETAYLRDLEYDGSFSNFLTLCADELTLPVSDDNRYLDAIATFVESTSSTSQPHTKLLDFVVDQIASAPYFFNERLSRQQLLKLKHCYLQSVLYEVKKSEPSDFERDSELDQFFNLQDFSNDELIWISETCAADGLSKLSAPSSKELILLAAAHRIFLADRANWDPNHSDPLNNRIFDDLNPRDLLEQIGISSPQEIQSFRISWGSLSFGALIKALHSSWYTGGIVSDAGSPDPFKQELLKLAFEEAMQPNHGFGSADLTWEFLRDEVHAKPQVDWLTGGISDTLKEHGFIPGELNPNWSDPLILFSEIQDKLKDASRCVDLSTQLQQKGPESDSNKVMVLLANNLKQRGLDISPEELQSWLKQELIDSLGDWRQSPTESRNGSSHLSLAKTFVGIEDLHLSEWDVDSILSRFFSLGTPSIWLEDNAYSSIPNQISEYCEQLKVLAPDIAALKRVEKLTSLIIGHPYGEYPSGFFDRFAEVKLRELTRSFGIQHSVENTNSAARALIRFHFTQLCDDLKDLSSINDPYDGTAIDLAERLVSLEWLNENQFSSTDLFKDEDLLAQLKAIAKLLEPDSERARRRVSLFISRTTSAIRSIADS